MIFTVYILYSPHLDKYYVGQTSLDIHKRLAYHLGNHRGYTSKAKDWQVVYSAPCNSRPEAISLERKIKIKSPSPKSVEIPKLL